MGRMSDETKYDKELLRVCDKLSIGAMSSLDIEYIGRGNIWINNTYDGAVIDLARYIIYEALCNTAPGQLTIVGYDSDLSGLFAPFATLSAGESKLLELISNEKDIETYLNYTWQQIQAVQNVIQGRARSLIDFRESTNRPIEGYKLIALSLDMGLIEDETRAKLAMLMRSGPAAGVSFLIISTTLISIQTRGEKDIDLSVEAIAPNITVLETKGNSVSIARNEKIVRYSPPSAETIIRKCEAFIESAKNAALPIVRFDELHDLSVYWNRNSIDGLSFVVGKYGVNDVEITIGDEINQRHNALITGAVGQGKSNLISVIIHSLCQHYSPKELHLYLLDFKEGVTLKPFSNIGQDEYLPHAKALGLESDVSFGFAVMESLFSEYQRRMKLLKENNVKSIRELRRQSPSIEMPRIVVVIDEFQMMFGDEIQTGQKVAELLEKSVRLFRAAGIHFILASQTLGGNISLAQKRENIFSQIPIRIAHKNSITESQQTLATNNSAAAFLRPREAIVNLDYGEISQNRKTAIAFADEKILKPLRRLWWENARAGSAPPYIFESERRITVSGGIETINELRKKAQSPTAVVGDKISINGERIALPLPNEPGRNIAIIGATDNDCNQAVGIMQSIAVSLAVQHPKGDARFLFCDFNGEEATYDKKYPQFATLMESVGYFIESIPRSQFDETIKSLQNETTSSDTVYVFGGGMDRWEYDKEPYGQGSSLKAFVETAPSSGKHFIGWWVKSSSFTSQVAGFVSSDAFNSKIFLRVDERTVQSLTSPFVRWASQKNRGLVSDAIEFAEEMVFIPYAPVTQNDANIFRVKIWDS